LLEEANGRRGGHIERFDTIALGDSNPLHRVGIDSRVESSPLVSKEPQCWMAQVS
jgi:hypothetical protein